MSHGGAAITPEDLYRYRWANGVRLQPTGDLATWHVSWADEPSRSYRSAIHLGSLHRGAQRASPITPDELCARGAEWAPSGRRLAFIGTTNGTNQIFVLDVETHELRQLTSSASGVLGFRWSPDEMHIAFTAPSGEEAREEPPVVRLRERLDDKLDGHGFSNGAYRHLHVTTLDGHHQRQLTRGDWHVGGFGPRPDDRGSFAWSADARSIFVAGDADPDADLRVLSNKLYAVDLAGALTPIADGILFLGCAVSPDGRWLSYVSPSARDGAGHWRLWVLPTSGGNPTCLSASSDVSVGRSVLSGTGEPLTFSDGPFPQRLVWSEDSQIIYFIASERGSSSIYSARLAGQVVPVAGGQRAIYDFDVRDDQIAYCANTPSGPSYLFAQDGMGEYEVDDFNPWLAARAVTAPRLQEVTVRDGRRIDMWLLPALAADDATRQPLILSVHGGPHSQYGWAFSHLFQVLAGRGFSVYYGNPRGSDGYGEEFRRLVVGDMGGGDYQDLMDALEPVLASGVADPHRLGVTGESYGGYMTNWIVTQTDRFAAAVAEASITNLGTQLVESDHVAVPDEHGLLGDLPLADIQEQAWQRSPLRHASRITTPLLTIHGEQDLRCPISHAEQLFGALRALRRPVRLARFPGEDHSLAQSGRPDRRVARLNLIADWFETHLVDASSPER